MKKIIEEGRIKNILIRTIFIIFAALIMSPVLFIVVQFISCITIFGAFYIYDVVLALFPQHFLNSSDIMRDEAVKYVVFSYIVSLLLALFYSCRLALNINVFCFGCAYNKIEGCTHAANIEKVYHEGCEHANGYVQHGYLEEACIENKAALNGEDNCQNKQPKLTWLERQGY